MTNPSPPELSPQRPIRSDFGRAPSYRARRMLTVAAILLVAGLGLRLLFSGPSVMRPAEIPTIASEGSYKQRPEQPGGIDIPHQDVQVYQALDNKDDAKPAVEHLLPPPETPQESPAPAPPKTPTDAREQAPQPESLTPSHTETTEQVLAPAPAANPPPPLAPPPAAAAPETAPAPNSVPAAPVIVAPLPATPQPLKPVAAPQMKTPVTKKTHALTIEQVLKATKASQAADAGERNPLSGTSRVVQLAAVQDESTAHAMVEKMQNQYAGALGAAELRVVRADLGPKGIYYRIQSQPVPGNRASGICAALKKVKAGCILVRP